MIDEQLRYLAARAKNWPGNHPAGWYVLKGIMVPYSEANLALAFKPHTFFNELEKIERKQKWLKERRSTNAAVFKNHYYRYIKKGLIEIGPQGFPVLTERGIAQLKKYEPKKLRSDAVVMVIFDIPELSRLKRSRLRTVLRQFRFTQVQKSVWQSKYDVAKYVSLEIQQQKLDGMVKIFEAAEIRF